MYIKLSSCLLKISVVCFTMFKLCSIIFLSRFYLFCIIIGDISKIFFSYFLFYYLANFQTISFHFFLFSDSGICNFVWFSIHHIAKAGLDLLYPVNVIVHSPCHTWYHSKNPYQTSLQWSCLDFIEVSQ